MLLFLRHRKRQLHSFFRDSPLHLVLLGTGGLGLLTSLLSSSLPCLPACCPSLLSPQLARDRETLAMVQVARQGTRTL